MITLHILESEHGGIESPKRDLRASLRQRRLDSADLLMSFLGRFESLKKTGARQANNSEW